LTERNEKLKEIKKFYSPIRKEELLEHEKKYKELKKQV